MSTRDLFSFEHMSYTSSPQYPSGSPVGMVDSFETGSENNVVDGGPPPAPVALSTYSTPPLPPKYRTIKPRFSDGGLMPKPPDDTLGVKPRRHRSSGTRRNRQRQPQEKIGEPNPVQPEADSSMVSFTRPRSESFVPVTQYTDSDLFSRSQGPSLAPFLFSYSNDLTSPAEIRSPLFPNIASAALAVDRPAYHHDVPSSLDSSDIQVSRPNPFFELSQDRDSMRAASLQFSEHLEKTQVLQSLSILQDYMAKYPSVFEKQAPEMVQKWMLDIEGVKPPGSLSE